jgi:rare lipoprotein A
LLISITLLAAGCAHQPADKTDERLAIDPDSVPDAVPRVEPRSRYGNPETYVVFGKRYSTLGSSDGFVERGVASWYGEDFHGKRASNGEPYDMFAMTAAHKSLPLPTYARVTNLENGRSVVVRVNDRGPFVGDRVIDLSWVAAAKLRLAHKGTGMVEVRAIDPEDPSPLPPADLDTGTRLASATVDRSPPASSAKKAEPNIAKPDPIVLLAAHSQERGGGATTAQKGSAASGAKAGKMVARAGEGSATAESSGGTAGPSKTAAQSAKAGAGPASVASKTPGQPASTASVSVAVRSPQPGPVAAATAGPVVAAKTAQSGQVAATTAAQSGSVAAAKPGQTAPKSSAAQTLYVQLGAFSTRENADRLRERVSKNIDKSVRVDATKADGHAVHRVRVGPVGSLGEAQLLAARLGSLGVSGARVVVD